MLGQRLRDRYHIIKLLGQGNFGDTYLAKDYDLPGHPHCVVKHLKPKDLTPALLPIARRLFETEAEVLYKLGKLHDRITTLSAHFEENGEVIWRDRVQVSQNLANILDKMVRDHFSKRYQNAQEALQAVLALSPKTPGSNNRTIPVPPPTSPSLPNTTRRTLLQLAGFTGGGFIIAVVSQNLWNKSPQPSPRPSLPPGNNTPSPESLPENLSPKLLPENLPWFSGCLCGCVDSLALDTFTLLCYKLLLFSLGRSPLATRFIFWKITLTY